MHSTTGRERRESLPGWLARHGFTDTTAAATALDHPAFAQVVVGFGQLPEQRRADPDLCLSHPQGPPTSLLLASPLVSHLGQTADPDLCLATMAQLAQAVEDPRDWGHHLGSDPAYTQRLLAVIGLSQGLAAYLVRHPECLADLSSSAFSQRMASWDPFTVGQRLLQAVDAAEGQSAALQRAYLRELLAVAADDLSVHGWGQPVSVVGRRLSTLAQATLETGLTLAWRSHLQVDQQHTRLALIAMGKCGGQELNYVSDVDVIFVAQAESGDLRQASTVAATLMQTCSATTSEGKIWDVDAALRPEGKAGPLVRTLASHEAYYRKWARTWEFQALLKARPAAGDSELGQIYVDTLAPLVWQACTREGFVADVQHMRQRVEGTLEGPEAARQIKLGKGGLRDVEFAVQLLQLVHGAGETSLRVPGTVQALQRLASGGYVGREDAAALIKAYEFLRALEHRLQLRKLTRTAVLPTDEAQLRILGRSLGMGGGDAAQALLNQRQQVAHQVRRLHEKLFYRPLLSAVAQLEPDHARLSPEAALARLQALGYRDPAGALAHLQALSGGVSRRAAIQRTLLPVMLGWFASAVDCDAGLLAFRQVSDALGSTSWYLRALRDEGVLAQRLAVVLASSRYVVDLLQRSPEALTLLGHDHQLQPVSPAHLASQVAQALARYLPAAPAQAQEQAATRAVLAVRGVRRLELLRTAARQVLVWRGEFGTQDTSTSCAALTQLTDASLAAALQVAQRLVACTWPGPWADGTPGQLPMRLTIIGMGRLGGHEMSYASDADVMFVTQPSSQVEEAEAVRAAQEVANQLRRLLAAPGVDPALEVDPNLRPEGRQGPLVRTLASYQAYYQRWGLVWEWQALLRARYVAGDAQLGQEFLALADAFRYPAQGLTTEQIREIRRIKARVDAERLPHGVDRHRHLKLGPGGLADVEWTVQLLQLCHAHRVPGLRVVSTLPALRAATDAGLMSPDQQHRLAQAWLLASRLRDAITLLTGRSSDVLPTEPTQLSTLARLLGYPPASGARLVEDYRRTTRQAHAVVEKLFWE